MSESMSIDCKADLRASSHLGSKRQLWHSTINYLTIPQEPGTFFLRPSNTRIKFRVIEMINSQLDFLLFKFGSISRIQNTYSKANFEKCFFSHPDQIVPLIIENCTSEASWPAGAKNWNLQFLLNILGKDRRMEIAQCDATVSFIDFVDYMGTDTALTDDNPPLIFETLVDGEHDCIIDNFNVPLLFTTSTDVKSRSGCHLIADSANDLLSEAADEGKGAS